MEPKRQLYFDNHATTPLDPGVLEAMLPYFTEKFGNPESSQHAYGWEAKSALDLARKQVATLLGAEASEIAFTSGATESIHLAILGHLETFDSPKHIITSNAEHKATLEVCARAAKFGHEVTILPVNQFGQVDTEQVRAALRENTALVSLMHGNNEIGSLNPIADIGAMLSARGIVFHVDAAQTVGKLPIDVRSMGADLLSLSAHKLYGPKGVGALFIRKKPKPHAPENAEGRIQVKPYLVGGGQERGLRGGTHNLPGIIGLGKACEISGQVMDYESQRLARLRDQLILKIRTTLDGVDLNGHPRDRLCNNINFTVHGVGSDLLLLGLKDIAYSSASACSSGTASHVLKAIGQDSSDPNQTTLRFGLGRFTTDEEVDTLAKRLIETIQNARGVSKG